MTNEEKIDYIRNNKPFRIADIIIAAALVAAMAAVLIFSYKKPGSYVLISYSGETVSYALKDDLKIELKDGDGQLMLKAVIESGAVYCEAASCPTKECVYTGKIRYNGQIIICAHYGVVIRIAEKANQNLIILG